MKNIDLNQYGITGTTEILYNPSYEILFDEEMKPGLTGYDKGVLTELQAVNVDQRDLGRSSANCQRRTLE